MTLTRPEVPARACGRCGAEFEARDPRKRFCCGACRSASFREAAEPEERSCVKCAALFTVPRESLRRYCSAACRPAMVPESWGRYAGQACGCGDPVEALGLCSACVRRSYRDAVRQAR